MKIETKYEIGQRVWILYENRGEVCVFDDIITEIIYRDKVCYFVKQACDEFEEDKMILYEDKEGLANKILELMEDIRSKEE